MFEASKFLDELLGFEGRLFAGEGVNAGMARATTAMCKAFDWPRLIDAGGPSRDDMTEFTILFNMLSPILAHTSWPRDGEFPEVFRGWPDWRAMRYQYALLVSRVCRAQQAFKQASRANTEGNEEVDDSKLFLRGKERSRK